MEAENYVPIGTSIDAVVHASTPSPTIVERLERRFGLGDMPARRRALYCRLQLLVVAHGDAVETLIKEAASAATGARNPGRYFAKAITLKLRETGVYTWNI